MTADTATACETAREALERLEAGRAAVEERLRAAGPGQAPAELLARSVALPALIGRARRELAPAALAHHDRQLALLAEEAAALDADFREAQEAGRRAEARRDEVALAARRNAAARRELSSERKQAWRLVQAHQHQPPAATVVAELNERLAAQLAAAVARGEA